MDGVLREFDGYDEKGCTRAKGVREHGNKWKDLLMFSHILGAFLTFYINRLPGFRGKRRLLTPFRRLLEGVPVRSRYGVTVMFDVADRTNWHAVAGQYGDTVPDAIKLLREGDCFIDVGANCGLFTLLARQFVGSSGLVVAFEPCLDTYAKLVANVRHNKYQNVLLFNFCVTDQSGILRLQNPVPGHSGLCAVAPSPAAAGSLVAGVNLSDFPAMLAMLSDRRTLIKVDVEGYELVALRGLASILARPETRTAVVEIDRQNLRRYGTDVQDVYSFLQTFGFEPTGLKNRDNHFDQVFSKGAGRGFGLDGKRPTGGSVRAHSEMQSPLG